MKIRIRNWLVLGAIGAGLIPLFVLGLFGYMNATKKPLHPIVKDVPSVTLLTVRPEWADAVAQVRQIARAGVAEQNLPGMSVAVGVGGEIVWAEGFGWADLDDKVKVTPDTRFRIGTASTALTSAAAGLLIEQGTMKLDDEIRHYVAAYPKKQWPVTVRQVMGHTAGIRNDGGDEGPLFSRQCQRAAEGLEGLDAFKTDQPRYEPGTQYSDSNYDWILVSAAIEAVVGEPFSRSMRKQVFEPLGMNDTRVESGSEPVSDSATSYFPKFAGDPRYGPDVMRPLSFSCYAGASAFVSTPSDLVRFAMAIEHGKFLQPSTVKLLQTAQRLPSGAETGYGLGWDLETVEVNGKQTGLVGHNGNILGGMAMSFITLPEYGISVAVTSNTSYAETYDLAIKIANALRTFGPR